MTKPGGSKIIISDFNLKINSCESSLYNLYLDLLNPY